VLRWHHGPPCDGQWEGQGNGLVWTWGCLGTCWRGQRKRSVRTPGESKTGRGTHLLEGTEGVTSLDMERKQDDDGRVEPFDGRFVHKPGCQC